MILGAIEIFGFKTRQEMLAEIIDGPSEDDSGGEGSTCPDCGGVRRRL